MTTATATVTTTTAMDKPAWQRVLLREGGYIAEVAALCGFVFARPILGSFGASPETFISRGGDASLVLLFAAVVVVAPIAVLSAVAAVAGLVGPRARFGAHLVVVGGLGALAFLQILQTNTDWGTPVARSLAVVGGVGLVAVRWRFDAAATFLQFAGAASLVFLLQFVLFSPTSSLIRDGRAVSIDPEVAAAVEAAVGDDAPPVVVVMLDALPTSSLLDGEGHIDTDVYPNLAQLAADGTWYRNHTTVAQDTIHAVPAALSGQLPDERGRPPVASGYERNLFTLLGGVYDTHAQEQVTALCPSSLCPDATDGTLRPLLSDARKLWRQSLDRVPEPAGLPGAFGQRHDDFVEWIDTQDFSPSPESSEFYFYHLLLPHDPWNWLPDGVRYHASMPAEGLWFGSWGTSGADVGKQRHVLQTQAVDRLLGMLFDRLRDAGIYDDAVIVVTADHGAAFVPEAPVRGLAEEQYDQIMWTPLIVKGSGQEEGQVDDGNVLGVDVLPLVASELGIDLDELGWEVDGMVPGLDGERDPADKAILDWKWGDLRAPGSDTMITVDGVEGFERVLAADLIPGSGPMAAWQRTDYGHLVGTSIDQLDRGEPLDTALELGGLARFDQIDLEEPLPLEVRGVSWLEEGDSVALVVNGTVAALVPADPTPYGVAAVHGLLWPDALVDGSNEVTAYQVTGPVDAPTVHALDVVDELPTFGDG